MFHVIKKVLLIKYKKNNALNAYNSCEIESLSNLFPTIKLEFIFYLKLVSGFRLINDDCWISFAKWQRHQH
jgi:hypothetical protein